MKMSAANKNDEDNRAPAGSIDSADSNVSIVMDAAGTESDGLAQSGSAEPVVVVGRSSSDVNHEGRSDEGVLMMVCVY